MDKNVDIDNKINFAHTNPYNYISQLHNLV